MTYTPISLSGKSLKLRENVFAVNLVYEKNKRMHVFEAQSPEEAIEKARFIADKLNVKIFDASKRSGKWVD